MEKIKIEIKWAILFSIASILWLGIERLLGWHDELISQHYLLTNIFAIVAILVYVLALRDKRDNYYGGVMSWKQGFIAGCIMSLFVALLTPVALYISINYVSPNYFPNMIEYSVENYPDSYPTRADAEAYFSLSNYIMQSAIFAVIVGVITSAIVAVFVKKKPSSTAG